MRGPNPSGSAPRKRGCRGEKRSGMVRPLLRISQAARGDDPTAESGERGGTRRWETRWENLRVGSPPRARARRPVALLFLRARPRSPFSAVGFPCRRVAAARRPPASSRSALVDDDLDAPVAGLAALVVVAGQGLVLPVAGDDALLVGNVAVLDQVVEHGHGALDREVAVRLPLVLHDGVAVGVALDPVMPALVLGQQLARDG